MTIKIKCRKCEAKFRVKDAAAGRRVKCRECGVPIKVPVPTTDEEELLNFDAAAYGDDPTTVAGPDTMPPRRRKKKTTGSESSAGSGRKWNLENPLLWFVVPVASAALVFMAMMIHFPTGWFAFKAILAVCILVSFITFWMIVFHAFGESVLSGLLCLFLPFYILYWVATEWHATKKMFLASIFAQLTVGMLFFSIFVYGTIIEATSNVTKIQEGEVQAEADAAP